MSTTKVISATINFRLRSSRRTGPTTGVVVDSVIFFISIMIYVQFASTDAQRLCVLHHPASSHSLQNGWLALLPNATRDHPSLRAGGVAGEFRRRTNRLSETEDHQCNPAWEPAS